MLSKSFKFLWLLLSVVLSSTGLTNGAGQSVNKCRLKQTEIDLEKIKKVHIIQSNHFDAGFADFLPRIMNRYFVGEEGTVGPPLPKNQTTYYESFFLTAGRIATEFSRLQTGVSYKYLTQSWLIDFFMNCPDDFPFVSHASIYPPSLPLKCPNQTTLEKVKRYVEEGHIYWHAFPHFVHLFNRLVSLQIHFSSFASSLSVMLFCSC